MSNKKDSISVELNKVVQEAEKHNSWFSRSNILNALSYWKNRLKKNGHKYYDEPYLRFKGTKYEQETFFVKDPNENILEIKTLTSNPD